MSEPQTPPTFLALDTASAIVTISVGSYEEQSQASLPISKSSGHLLGCIADLLVNQGRSPRDISGLLCTAGPGSFTGIRVGMATVMGLAESLEIPAVALPSLWTQAHWASDNPALQGARPRIASVLKAHRDQYFVQTFKVGGGVCAEGPIVTTSHLLNDLADTDLPVISGDPQVLGFEWQSERLVLDSGAIATHLIKLASINPPRGNLPNDRNPSSSPAIFAWDSRSLTRPLYAHTPAVATRPTVRAGGSLISQD